MPAGLFLPLQLAANLLALGAAAGFAAVVLLRVGSTEPADASRRSGLADALLVAGSVALVAGHGIDGALIPERSELVGWLLAGGLALIAVGAAPSRLPDPAAVSGPGQTTSGPTTGALVVAVPALVALPPPSAALVGAIAGGLGALRLAFGGRATVLVALAVALWGAASGLQLFDGNLATLCTLGGSAALGAWIWQVSVAQLRAKIVVAFLITVLLLVAGLATVLSAGGASDLVEQEQVTLQTSARELANEIAVALPERSVTETVPLRQAPVEVDLLVVRNNVDGLRFVIRQLTQQDAMIILDLETGEAVVTAHRSDDPSMEFAGRLSETPVAQDLIGGAREAGGVVRVEDQIVAVGGGQVAVDPDAVGEPDEEVEEARYAVVGARIVNQEWLEQEAAPLPFAVGLEVGGELGASTGVPPEVVGRLLAQGADRREVQIDGESLLVAGEPIVDPLTGDSPGRVVTVRSGGVVTELQHEQARQLFVLALLGALIAAGVAGMVAGRLLAPVRRLTAAAAAVGRGKLDTTVAVDSPDEIGTLGRTFDQMTRSLAGQARQLRDAADEQARLRARLEALTASMSDGLVATDEDGKVITFNPAAARLTGQDPADVEGLPLDRALILSDDQPATETLGGVRSDEVRAARVLVVRTGGDPVPTDITAAPVRDSEDRIVGRVLVLRDVTREAEVERMKTEFLSNVSHELRTPLTPIRGFADVLSRRDVAPQEVQRYAGQIVSSAERLERVVTRIVDFAALDSGRMPARIEGIDLSALINDVLDDWRRRLPARQFRRRVARELPLVETDHTMLTRCLDELVDNAVKFSNEDEPVIVAASCDDSAVRLTVRDRGVGFEPERAAAVFGEFYQVDASETRHFDGLGLGLALVRRIVDELGGDATVESAPGQGAAFHLWLPVAGQGSVSGPTAAAPD